MGAIGRNVLPRWIGFSTQGATGSSVNDVLYEASITLGAATGDFLSLPRSGINLTPSMPTRVLACRTFRADIDPEIAAHFEHSLELLTQSGVEVIHVDAPSDNDTIWSWFVISTAELTQSLRHEEHRWDQLTDYVQAQLRFGKSVTIDQYIEAQRKRHEVTARFDALLADGAVLVTPTVNARAWPAQGPLPSTAGTTSDPMITLNTPDNNFTGHPAVSVPMGLDNHAVPCGLQVISARCEDGLALGLAQQMEKIQPWPLVAPGYSPFTF
jgi:aspartyl-tRNA(Asn)/glutamyl-tRNA(Gln) amidotransferase subunit A